MYDHEINEGTAPQGIRTSIDLPLSAESARRRALVADPYEADERFCASYCGTSRHLKVCALGIGGPEIGRGGHLASA